MDMSLSKLRIDDGQGIHGVTKSQTWLSDWTEPTETIKPN